MTIYALSTTDNPYNPFDDYESWLYEDRRLEHHCNEILARICKVSDALSDYEYNSEVSQAIDTFLKLDLTGLYCKVTGNEDVDVTIPES